jgi:hypothetical protein
MGAVFIYWIPWSSQGITEEEGFTFWIPVFTGMTGIYKKAAAISRLRLFQLHLENKGLQPLVLD